MIENNYYLINDTYIFKYSGIGNYPINNTDLLTGRGKIVNIKTGTLTLCEDPEEQIGVIPVNEVISIQQLTSIELDEILNEDQYNYDQI